LAAGDFVAALLLMLMANEPRLSLLPRTRCFSLVSIRCAACLVRWAVKPESVSRVPCLLRWVRPVSANSFTVRLPIRAVTELLSLAVRVKCSLVSVTECLPSRIRMAPE
jgi:hypothetical protein